ncbi:HEAT repeat protein [Posidoniimonas polymericola]|uniref:HEAT repeat protein n=1 Tax=Posidoniimonas polymericola TaxID=2528002 RepID=A0A5C5YSP9_9BACT|nr:HEAT repeat domain-containing protein [Posidoniimonas polymericola]TWT77667.1 HEAT repeat protein [Posidoniimonas polymericola]
MTFTRNTLLLLTLATTAGCQSGPLGGLVWNPFSRAERTSYETPAMRTERALAAGDAADGTDSARQQELTVELARKVQTEPDPLVRDAIMKSVAKFKTPLAGQVLTAGLQDADPMVRRRCCELLGRRGDPASTAALAETLRNDTDQDVRIEAVRALGNVRSPETNAALVAALESRDPAMQYAGVQSLAKATGRDFNGDVRACLAYAKGESPAAAQEDQTSVASRVGRYLPF